MSIALNRENFVLHKLQSLTGIIPVGFYMVQHLTLNSFSLTSEEKFDAVIGFFEGLPPHILLAAEALFIWLPLLFHAIYGIFITGRAKQNFIGTKYGWSQNRMYTLQRVSGIVIFFFLILHVTTTTIYKYMTHNADVIRYAAWQDKLTSFGHIWFVVYLIGILASTYHLSYGIWNFCIRWGIAVSDEAQVVVQKLSFVSFVVLTLLGWAALTGFLIHTPKRAVSTSLSPPSFVASLVR